MYMAIENLGINEEKKSRVQGQRFTL